MPFVAVQQKLDQKTRDLIIQRLQMANSQYHPTYAALAAEYFPALKPLTGWRRVADLMRELTDAGFCIVTSNGDDPGVWMAKTDEEVILTTQRWIKQAKMLLSRVKKVKKSWRDGALNTTIFDDMTIERLEEEFKDV